MTFRKRYREWGWGREGGEGRGRGTGDISTSPSLCFSHFSSFIFTSLSSITIPVYFLSFCLSDYHFFFSDFSFFHASLPTPSLYLFLLTWSLSISLSPFSSLPIFFSLRLPLPLNIPFLSSLSNFLLPSQFPFPHLSLSSSPSPFLHLPLLFLTSLSLSLSSSPSPFLLIHMLRPNKRRDPLIRRTHKPGTNTHVSLHSMTSSP